METRKYSSPEQALAVAKEAMWLAWNAAGREFGSGVFQANPGADKEAVWLRAYNEGDYTGRHTQRPERVNADYVFGRMLKLRFEIKADTLEIPEQEPKSDYQAWCASFRSYAALFNAAETVLEVQQAA